eukprot:scaffold75510_cov51-Cyclotella_meneghiniana.AAC.2
MQPAQAKACKQLGCWAFGFSKIMLPFAPPRQFGAENRSMCITLLVNTAMCATETDRPNGLPRRCECDGYCQLTDMGRIGYVKKLTVDGHG